MLAPRLLEAVLHHLGNAEVGGRPHDFDPHLGRRSHPCQVLGGAVQRTNVQENQFVGLPRVSEQARHAQLGVLQLAAAWNEDRRQARRRGDRQRLFLGQLLSTGHFCSRVASRSDDLRGHWRRILGACRKGHSSPGAGTDQHRLADE
jgi:hypothetical protein